MVRVRANPDVPGDGDGEDHVVHDGDGDGKFVEGGDGDDGDRDMIALVMLMVMLLGDGESNVCGGDMVRVREVMVIV